MKKLIAFTLAISMLASAVPVQAAGVDNAGEETGAVALENVMEQSAEDESEIIEESVADESERSEMTEDQDTIEQKSDSEEISKESEEKTTVEQESDSEVTTYASEKETTAEQESETEEVHVLSQKEVINLNSSWTLKDGDSVSTVNIPHSWEYVHPTMSFIPQMNMKTVTYTKTIDVSEYKNRHIFLKFYAVNKNATIYVDGQEVGTHIGGFSAFTFDITDYISGDIAEIRVDNTNLDTKTMPVNTDFTHWAGIYRDVELIVTDDAYISVEDYGSEGVYVDQTVENGNGILKLRTKLSSKSDADTDLVLKSEVFAADNSLVASQTQDVTLASNKENQEQTADFVINNAHLWNGTIDPYLYTAKVTLMDKEGNVIDQISQRFGFRTFEIKGGTFYLNGKEYELHGVGMHQDREGYGNALTDAMREEDFANIKELGANAVRTAHYPHAQKIYDLADEYGFIVWNEIPFYMIMADTELFRDTCKQELIEMIRQSYNHPSIICWGIQNEVNTSANYATYGPEFAVDTETLGDFIRELAALAKEEDDSRLVVQAHITGSSKLEESKTWTVGNEDIDYTAFNYYFGFKSADSPIASADEEGKNKIKRQYSNTIEKYKNELGADAIMISEYGAGGNIHQHATINGDFSWSDASTEAEHPEEYQCFVLEAAYDAISSRDDVWCAFVWNMFDFSCYRNEGGTTRLNNKGLMTYDHKQKKDSFYFYKANWNTSDKFVHVNSRRKETWNNADAVRVYSNCDQVKLYLNGEEIGVGENVQSGVFVWENLTYNNGENTIKVIGDDLYTEEIVIHADNENIPDNFTGLAMKDGELQYYSKGVENNYYVGIAEYEGVDYYVNKGKVDPTFTNDVVLSNGQWYYIENGIVNYEYTGLCKHAGTWYYIENGILNWEYTGLAQYNGQWYYVENGVLNWDYTGLTKYYSTWYYVEKGVLNWNYTGLVKYYSTWYYVEKGVLNWNYTGLTKYYSTWYYVENGRLNWNYTGLVKYYSTWYYVEKGVLNWNYTGTYGGKVIVNGVVK